MEKTRNEVLVDEEKMKKKFKILKNIVGFIKDVLTIMGIVFIIADLIYAISLRFETEEEKLQERNFLIEEFNIPKNENAEISVIDLMELQFGINEKYTNIILRILKLLITVITYVLGIILLSNLEKIFKNISADGKPFSEENNKRLKIVNILAWIMWLCGGDFISIGLVTVIALSAVTNIYQYGYKLQIESDETL